MKNWLFSLALFLCATGSAMADIPDVAIIQPLKQHDAAGIEKLVMQGFPINKPLPFTKNASSLFHLAVAIGDEATVKMLLKHGADPVLADWAPQRTPPLLIAVDRKQKANAMELTKILIAAGAKVNAPDSSGNLPIHSAVKQRNYEATEYLIAKGANVNAKNNEGLNPLGFAVFQRDLPLVKLLVKSKANVNDSIADAPSSLALLMRLKPNPIDKEIKGELIRAGAKLPQAANPPREPLTPPLTTKQSVSIDENQTWFQDMLKHGDRLPELLRKMQSRTVGISNVLSEIKLMENEVMLLALKGRSLPPYKDWHERIRQSFLKSLSFEEKSLKSLKTILETNNQTLMPTYTEQVKDYRTSFQEGRVLLISNGTKEMPNGQ